MSDRVRSTEIVLKATTSAIEQFVAEHRHLAENSAALDVARVEIASQLNKLQSILDYWAAEIAERFTGKPGKYWPQFPIAETEEDFRPQLGKFTNLKSTRPDIAEYLESVQPFRNGFNRWLHQLRTLNGSNKHDQLLKHIRHERAAIDTWALQGGPPVLGRQPRKRRQYVFRSAEMTIQGTGPFEVQWVDLQFAQLEISVAPFLLRALDGVSEIHEDLSKLVQ